MKLSSTQAQTYEVTLSHGLLTRSAEALVEAIGDRRALVVATPTVDKLYGACVRAALMRQGSAACYRVLSCSEASKTLDLVATVCGWAQDHGLDREGALVAVGGGVCSDIVGFSASMVRRGVRYIRVPTTLLAQVDAGIGLKTGVNFNGAKSYLGAFHPPTAVLVDPTALRTLTAEQLRQGLAEIVKIAVVRDAALVWKLISQGPALLSGGLQHPPELRDEVIRRAIALMLEELERNPTEKLGYERLVDFGHTFSPLLEAATGFRLSHGDAVAVDMALSCLIGVELNLTHPSVAEQVIALLVQLGLPIFRTELTLDLGEKAVASALAHRGGSLNLVVPTTLGAATFVRTPEELPRAALASALAHLEQRARGLPGEGTRKLQSRGRRYRFDDPGFESVIAHGGQGLIRTLRAEHRLEDGLYDFIDLTTVPAGHSIGSHTHEPDDEEVYVVIDGRGLMQMDGREFEVGAGDVIVNRRGGTHGLTNIGQDDLRLVALNVRAPPGANDLG